MKICGGHGPGETPGPIPNPEAKTWHGDGTASGRVWESSTPPHPNLTGRGHHTCPLPFRIPGHTREHARMITTGHAGHARRIPYPDTRHRHTGTTPTAHPDHEPASEAPHTRQAHTTYKPAIPDHPISVTSFGDVGGNALALGAYNIGVRAHQSACDAH